MIIGMVAGFMVCQNTNNTRVNNLLSAYNSYNKATEDLLDTLDNEYDWVDAFDPQDSIQCESTLSYFINKLYQ